eukprot:2195733-Heterocapsa_arctica.AAC.1
MINEALTHTGRWHALEELGRFGKEGAKICVDWLKLMARSAHHPGGSHLQTLNFVLSVCRRLRTTH